MTRCGAGLLLCLVLAGIVISPGCLKDPPITTGPPVGGEPIIGSWQLTVQGQEGVHRWTFSESGSCMRECDRCTPRVTEYCSWNRTGEDSYHIEIHTLPARSVNLSYSPDEDVLFVVPRTPQGTFTRQR